MNIKSIRDTVYTLAFVYLLLLCSGKKLDVNRPCTVVALVKYYNGWLTLSQLGIFLIISYKFVKTYSCTIPSVIKDTQQFKAALVVFTESYSSRFNVRRRVSRQICMNTSACFSREWEICSSFNAVLSSYHFLYPNLKFNVSFASLCIATRIWRRMLLYTIFILKSR